ncbi:MAG: cation-translocating P-type ATPase [Deinococcota bacterium]
MTTTQLDLSFVLPGHPPEADTCLDRLEQKLTQTSGIEKAYFQKTKGNAELCIHYDADLLTLDGLERTASEVGAEVQARYKHATLRLSGLHCNDCANSIDAVASRLDGVLAVNTNYATEKMRVTYDSAQVSSEQIMSEVKSLGYQVNPQHASAQAFNDTSTPDDEAEREGTRHTGKVFGVPLGLALSLLSGAALLTGWLGESFFAFPFRLALAFYLIAYVAGGYDASKHAVRAALKGRFDIDVLMVVAAVGAASLGEWPEGALLLFLFSLGHALEHYAMDRARGAIRALADLAPDTARVRREDGEREISVSELRIGDTVIVRPGERLPADGEVLEGRSAVDQAPITGESVPVEKVAGDGVFAGTINGDGSLIFKTTKAAEDSTLARVVDMVEQAQTAKAPSHRFTDRFQRVFTPIILVTTVLLIVLPPLFGFPFEESFIRAMTLLVAASPCALALATPSAVLSGIARAARSGVLIKGGAHLENAGTAEVVVFDKTGTLTNGSPEVTDIIALNGTGDELLALAASVEAKSAHPLAAAVVQAAEAQHLELAETGDLESVTGKGVVASVQGELLRIGNRKLLHEAGIPVPQEVLNQLESLESEGKTSVLVAHGTALLGILALRDEPRQAAKTAIRQLKALGVKRTVMLTGDNRLVAEAIGQELGLDEVKAELLPEDKVAAIKTLKETFNKIIMIGDGVNDAPAMVEATVGVAMGGAGTDVALETADIALMADDLTKLPYALSLSRASRRMIVQNLIISLGVIVLLVPSAIFGLATISIAIVFHEGSTLVVVANALRLLGFKNAQATT